MRTTEPGVVTSDPGFVAFGVLVDVDGDGDLDVHARASTVVSPVNEQATSSALPSPSTSRLTLTTMHGHTFSKTFGPAVARFEPLG